jgi:hypothetical protein
VRIGELDIGMENDFVCVEATSVQMIKMITRTFSCGTQNATLNNPVLFLLLSPIVSYALRL